MGMRGGNGDNLGGKILGAGGGERFSHGSSDIAYVEEGVGDVSQHLTRHNVG